MGLLTWILVGLVAGFAAQSVMSGGIGGLTVRRLLVTTVLGIAGAIIGGLISSALDWGNVTGFNVRSLLIAAGGAVLVILAWRRFVGRGRRRILGLFAK